MDPALICAAAIQRDMDYSRTPLAIPRSSGDLSLEHREVNEQEVRVYQNPIVNRAHVNCYKLEWTDHLSKYWLILYHLENNCPLSLTPRTSYFPSLLWRSTPSPPPHDSPTSCFLQPTTVPVCQSLYSAVDGHVTQHYAFWNPVLQGKEAIYLGTTTCLPEPRMQGC